MINIIMKGQAPVMIHGAGVIYGNTMVFLVQFVLCWGPIGRTLIINFEPMCFLVLLYTGYDHTFTPWSPLYVVSYIR